MQQTIRRFVLSAGCPSHFPQSFFVKLKKLTFGVCNKLRRKNSSIYITRCSMIDSINLAKFT